LTICSDPLPLQVMQIREVMTSRGWGPLPTVYEGAYSTVQRDVERELIPLCRCEPVATIPVCTRVHSSTHTSSRARWFK
jgi:hypothetical protein